MDMAQKLIYPAIFYPDETGGFTVDVPDLPGCVTQGDNISDAIDMAVDAAGGWIMTELEDGNAVPDASPLHKIVPDDDIAPDGFIQYIVLDITAYSRRHGKQTVKKNLTIPAWLETLASDKNINFSQVLQEALLEKLHIVK